MRAARLAGGPQPGAKGPAGKHVGAPQGCAYFRTARQRAADLKLSTVGVGDWRFVALSQQLRTLLLACCCACAVFCCCERLTRQGAWCLTAVRQVAISACSTSVLGLRAHSPGWQLFQLSLSSTALTSGVPASSYVSRPGAAPRARTNTPLPLLGRPGAKTCWGRRCKNCSQSVQKCIKTLVRKHELSRQLFTFRWLSCTPGGGLAKYVATDKPGRWPCSTRTAGARLQRQHSRIRTQSWVGQ